MHFSADWRTAIGSVDADSPLGQWLDWAKNYAEVSDPLERFQNRQKAIRLFFNAVHEIRHIKAKGFEILLCDRRPGGDWLSEVLELGLPEEVVLPCETTTPGYVPRTFCIPAAVLNEKAANLMSNHA